jgi:beta-phosphoglucomutase
MKIKAVIFDLDGVIISTDLCHYQAWKEIADKEGVYFDPEINHQLRGAGRMESLEIILRKSRKIYSLEEKQFLAEEKNKIYKKLIENISEDSLFPGVTDTLNGLRERKIKIALGSSSKSGGFILGKTGITDLFDAVIDGNSIRRSKPDPEVFIKAALELNMPCGYCAVVEDAPSGIEAAKAAGMTAIVIGGADVRGRADYKIDRLNELLILTSDCFQNGNLHLAPHCAHKKNINHGQEHGLPEF